jgi:hypothetical protein
MLWYVYHFVKRRFVVIRMLRYYRIIRRYAVIHMKWYHRMKLKFVLIRLRCIGFVIFSTFLLLTPPLVIKVPVPSLSDSRTCMCVMCVDCFDDFYNRCWSNDKTNTLQTNMCVQSLTWLSADTLMKCGGIFFLQFCPTAYCFIENLEKITRLIQLIRIYTNIA